MIRSMERALDALEQEYREDAPVVVNLRNAIEEAKESNSAYELLFKAKAEAERQRDEYKADAERYRCFKAHMNDPDFFQGIGCQPTPEEMDAGIDAALAAKSGEEGK